MKYVLVLVLLVSFVMLPVLACADTPEDLRTLGDTLVGKNPSCPALYEIGVAKIFKDVMGKKVDIRTELDYQCDINSINNDNQIKLRTIFEF